MTNGTYKTDHVNGEVLFDHVWFAYHEADYVLKNISLQIKDGETIALVGATGAGKSSIINLLNRFYTTYNCKIFYIYMIQNGLFEDAPTHSFPSGKVD